MMSRLNHLRKLKNRREGTSFLLERDGSDSSQCCDKFQYKMGQDIELSFFSIQ